MKSAAIICEFNPLHTGHKRLLDYAKSVADKTVCIMSGNFTQRGLPACADKYSRAKHAVLAGADLVVELPTVFAAASAENFAFGGVAIAKTLCCDYLIFGSECGNITVLQNCANAIDLRENQQRVKEQVASGVSYPKALALATGLAELDKPNNVLAIEYIRALQKQNCTATPLTVKRDDNFNAEIATAGEYASSAMLRKDPSLRKNYTFDYVSQDIDDEVENKYKQMIPAFMSVMSTSQLALTEGVTEGLENRIFRADKSRGYEQMVSEIKTKRYTMLKLQRIMLNAVLQITKDCVTQQKQNFPQTKVLAVKRSATTLLRFVNDGTDPVTDRADKLYGALTGKSPPNFLPVYDD